MIIFPFDSDSELILRSLVSKESFDPDCIHYDFAAYGEDSICYSYFGSRLMELYEEVENPTPRGFVEKWLERKSGARYAMMATLVGVLMAVILGMLKGVASLVIKARSYIGIAQMRLASQILIWLTYFLVCPQRSPYAGGFVESDKDIGNVGHGYGMNGPGSDTGAGPLDRKPRRTWHYDTPRPT
ncbi:hypothetical protein DL764_000216 [Monosporascus ibericus]|uniref:Uncharacterized protein n=1 Tax=Monosporascus ibericus TaxID=155417 RepID=A0A4Q4TUD1_9PEZI|nr:hypothetical protein DL764_000216 [Monosporascus ibericus]